MKQIVDEMSYCKMNTLSIHFTDDQSFPLVINQYPLLSQQSAYSNYSHNYTYVLMFPINVQC
jgi:N-acetyl-beta-hexosaminidase